MRIDVDTNSSCNYDQVCVDFHIEDDSIISLVLPNGQKVVLEVRLDGPTLNVCLPEMANIATWRDLDLNPSLSCSEDDKNPHLRKAKQVCFELPKWFKEE